MNILLTSVGRRAYMVKFFKEVLNDKGQVHVCNSDDLSVAFKYADKSIISPLIYDDNYIPFLLNYCKGNHIDAIISLFDIDLLILAKNKKEFEKIGTKVIVSDPEFVSICNDKWKTYLYLKENGFNVPKTYLTLDDVKQALESKELCYPIIVKPRFGCGSIALSVADDEMSLLYLYNHNTKAINQTYLKYESAAADEKIIYQECLKGQEYGVDIINDLDGNYCNSIVKKKIAMRSGETDIAELVEEPIILKEAERLGNITGHIANMDCDFFLVDEKAYVLEMNARFGGGYPFSHIGGCNLPKAIINWINKENVSKETLSSSSGIKIYKELVLTKE